MPVLSCSQFMVVAVLCPTSGVSSGVKYQYKILGLGLVGHAHRWSTCPERSEVEATGASVFHLAIITPEATKDCRKSRPSVFKLSCAAGTQILR